MSKTIEKPKAEAVDLDRLVRLLKSKAVREWRAIWRQYPIYKRTDEERQIVNDEQIRIDGYIQALDDILAKSPVRTRSE